jgi:hypothetical protein
VTLLAVMVACTGEEPNGPAERACNGRPDLCDRALDEVVLAVAHNAMNVEDEGWTLPNQHHGYERQVEDGVRGFMLDVHDDGGVPTLCHGDCSLGSEPLADGLARFAALLDAWPDEVFVFVVQDEVEAAPIVETFEASGLLDRVITEVSPWPTLRELIDADTRLLVTHEHDQPDAPAWYHPTYTLAWDNDYAASTIEDFDCAVLRGDPANEVFLLNHFLTRVIASEDQAAEANPREVLLDHVDRCEAETGDQVNWLAVDFYDVGDTLSVVGELNDRAAP